MQDTASNCVCTDFRFPLINSFYIIEHPNKLAFTCLQSPRTNLGFMLYLVCLLTSRPGWSEKHNIAIIFIFYWLLVLISGIRLLAMPTTQKNCSSKVVLREKTNWKAFFSFKTRWNSQNFVDPTSQCKRWLVSVSVEDFFEQKMETMYKASENLTILKIIYFY